MTFILLIDLHNSQAVVVLSLWVHSHRLLCHLSKSKYGQFRTPEENQDPRARLSPWPQRLAVSALQGCGRGPRLIFPPFLSAFPGPSVQALPTRGPGWPRGSYSAVTVGPLQGPPHPVPRGNSLLLCPAGLALPTPTGPAVVAVRTGACACTGVGGGECVRQQSPFPAPWHLWVGTPGARSMDGLYSHPYS